MEKINDPYPMEFDAFLRNVIRLFLFLIKVVRGRNFGVLL